MDKRQAKKGLEEHAEGESLKRMDVDYVGPKLRESARHVKQG